MDVGLLGLGGEFEVDYLPKITKEELLENVEGYDALVVRSRTKVDAAVMARATKLKIVGRPGTGLDNVDLVAANAKGVEVVNSPEALVEGVAEHVIGLMLALARSIPEADSVMKSGKWEKDRFVGTELKGKTLGIAGLGRIGRRVGDVARALGMNLIGYDVIEIPREILSSLGCRMVDLDTLFSSADFITLHVPLTNETRHLVDTRRLSLMKPGAFLVNTSRGEVIDEAALLGALGAGRIGGAALDVFEKEPPSLVLANAPRLITTPHIAGQTRDAQTAAITSVGSKISKFFASRS